MNIVPQLKGDGALPYQDSGFLCALRDQRESQKISDFLSDKTCDDNHNVWIEKKKTPLDCLLGGVLDSPPSHGFVDWFALDQPIARMKACLLTGKRSFRGEEAPPALTGLKLDRCPRVL